MKKLVKSVLMLSIASLAILSSCKKDDDNADVTDVKVDINGPTGNVTLGSTVTLQITATGNADNKVKSISVTRSMTGTNEKTILSKSLSGTSAVETVVDTPDASGNYIYTVAITGEKGSPATKTFSVKVLPPPGELYVETDKKLYGHNNGAGTNPNFMSLHGPNFTTYSTNTFAANKSSIDLAFYYGTNNKASISSPSDAVMQGLFTGLNWDGVNATGLSKTTKTVAEFDAIAASNSDAVITELASNVTAWDKTATLLSSGSVYLFKTHDNKLGLLKIVSITGSSKDDAVIQFAIAAQE
jgi:hypothetical protein